MKVPAALLALTLLSGCGLQPLYAGGSGGAVAQGLAAIEVPAIPDREGWLMRNALLDRFGGLPCAHQQLADVLNFGIRPLEGLRTGIHWGGDGCRRLRSRRAGLVIRRNCDIHDTHGAGQNRQPQRAFHRVNLSEQGRRNFKPRKRECYQIGTFGPDR